MTQLETNIRFQETQQFRQGWLWALVLMVVGCLLLPIVIYAIEPEAIGGMAAVIGWGVVAILFSAMVLYFFYTMRLETEVRADGLYVRFFPLRKQEKIAYEQIEACNATAYSPIRDYGGWGVRLGKKGQAYNVSGNEGVQLRLAEARPLLIGSQRAAELAEAINQMRRA